MRVARRGGAECSNARPRPAGPPGAAATATARDEAARPRRRRAHRARRPPHRPRPGSGDARRAPARPLRTDRPGQALFALFAAMAETERENIRESTLEGLDAAARKGKHGGRPPVLTDGMLHTVLRRRANGESVEQVQPDLIIPTGKGKGQSPSVASISGKNLLIIHQHFLLPSRSRAGRQREHEPRQRDSHPPAATHFALPASTASAQAWDHRPRRGWSGRRAVDAPGSHSGPPRHTPSDPLHRTGDLMAGHE